MSVVSSNNKAVYTRRLGDIFLRGTRFLPNTSYSTEAVPEKTDASNRHLECCRNVRHNYCNEFLHRPPTLVLYAVVWKTTYSAPFYTRKRMHQFLCYRVTCRIPRCDPCSWLGRHNICLIFFKQTTKHICPNSLSAVDIIFQKLVCK
jgi:hypothetical protein